MHIITDDNEKRKMNRLISDLKAMAYDKSNSVELRHAAKCLYMSFIGQVTYG